MNTQLSVEISQGTLIGFQDGDFVRFHGVPYAQPPVGELRFKDPLPPKPWDRERDASSFGPRCPQPELKALYSAQADTPSSEDCLYLNIISRTDTGAGRPVLVFFHGGANLFGNSIRSAQGGSFLLQNSDVILITVGYRLGPFGYVHFDEFSTPERPLRSNLGTKDQLLALQWIRENIHAFGGNPDNVTIWGQSAGGKAVGTLLAVPQAKGLFARAILESAPITAVLDKPDAELYARMFLEALGARPDEALQALTQAPTTALVAAASKLGTLVGERRPGARYLAPVVDGDFLPTRVIDAFTSGRAHPVPTIVGTNRDDVVTAQLKPGSLVVEATDHAAVVAAMDPARAAELTSVYPELPNDRGAAISFCGDLQFWIPSVVLAENQSQVAPTYMYRYEWSSEKDRQRQLGAHHSIELSAFFGPEEQDQDPSPAGVAERKAFNEVAGHLHRRWLAFATDGTPGPNWPQYDTDSRQTLLFDAREAVESDPRSERRVFWDGFDISDFYHFASETNRRSGKGAS